MGVFSNSQWAWARGMRTQPLLRGTPKALPAFSCHGAACMQMASLAETHMVYGTPGIV